MGQKRILIVDDNDDFREALVLVLSERHQVRSCGSGMEALSLLKKEIFDVLVLDLILPELDGLSLLYTMATYETCPVVLVTTAFLSDQILNTLAELGVGYVMRKPCSIKAIAARVEKLTDRLNVPARDFLDSRAYVRKILIALGFSEKHMGFAYTREAILIMAEHPGMAVTKELYPAAAEACGRKGCSVERAIRTALEAAWEQGDWEVWSYFFPYHTRRPANAAFIAKIAECLRQRQSIRLMGHLGD